jgi:hypothetical protein
LFVGSCLFALPSRASKPPRHLGNAACRSGETLHHRCAGTGSGLSTLNRQSPRDVATLNSEKSNTYGCVWSNEL